MAVITMSRQVGAGGLDLAKRLYEELGLAAFDKHMMLRVASEVGIPPEEIVDYSEAEYERRGFLDELFRRSRSVTEFSMWVGSPAIGYERRPRILDEYDAVNMVRATILAAYTHDDMLVIGRGGQAILEFKPDVLHLRVVAPFEDRQARLEEEQSMTPAQARRYLQEMDANTAEYLRTFHHIDVDDPTLYHLVLNLGKLGVDGAVMLVKAALALMPKRGEAESAKG
jgi:CMP/dCMP kinase